MMCFKKAVAKKTLRRRKKELEKHLEALYRKRASPTTGYRDFSRTEPFSDEIEQTKYEIGQIDNRISRRRDIVVSLTHLRHREK